MECDSGRVEDLSGVAVEGGESEWGMPVTVTQRQHDIHTTHTATPDYSTRRRLHCYTHSHPPVHDCIQPVRHRETRGSRELHPDRSLDGRVRLHVHRGRGLVHDDHAGAGQQCAGDAEQLALRWGGWDVWVDDDK